MSGRSKKTRIILFDAGGIMMCLGAVLALMRLTSGAVIFSLGALLFVIFHRRGGGDGSLTVRRLRRLLCLSDFLLLLTALLMIADIIKPAGIPYFFYLKYIHGNWVVALLLAAVFLLYATVRIDKEGLREREKEKT